MKNKLPILLLSSLLLVGCGSSNSSSNESKNSSLSSSESTTSETISISESESSQTSESSEESESSSEEESLESSSEESSKTSSTTQEQEVATYKASFYSKTEGQTGDSKSTSFASVIQSYFLDGDIQLVKDASSPEGYCQINYVGDKGDDNRFKTLTLGSSKTVGSLLLEFNVEIVEITLELQGYCKYISYSDSWSKDKDCILRVNDNESITLPYAEEGAPEIIYQTYEFVDGVNELNFLAEQGRVFLHSLEITYLM